MAGIKMGTTLSAVALLALSCLAMRPAHADTVGTSVGGVAYKFGSDVAGGRVLGTAAYRPVPGSPSGMGCLA